MLWIRGRSNSHKLPSDSIINHRAALAGGSFTQRQWNLAAQIPVIDQIADANALQRPPHWASADAYAACAQAVDISGLLAKNDPVGQVGDDDCHHRRQQKSGGLR